MMHDADKVQRMVLARTGLLPRELTCEYEQVKTEPCIIKHGKKAALKSDLCKSCKMGANLLLQAEIGLVKSKQRQNSWKIWLCFLAKHGNILIMATV